VAAVKENREPLEHKPYLREIKLRRADIEDFNIYPFGISGIKGLDSLQFHPDVTFFVGENGTGKIDFDRGDRRELGDSIPKAVLSSLSLLRTEHIQSCIPI